MTLTAGVWIRAEFVNTSKQQANKRINKQTNERTKAATKPRRAKKPANTTHQTNKPIKQTRGVPECRAMERDREEALWAQIAGNINCYDVRVSVEYCAWWFRIYAFPSREPSRFELIFDWLCILRWRPDRLLWERATDRDWLLAGAKGGQTAGLDRQTNRHLIQLCTVSAIIAARI